MSLPPSHLGLQDNPISPSSNHNPSQSSLEKGQNRNSQVPRDIPSGNCFDINYIDISKDGIYGVLTRSLGERQLDSLIDGSPQGKLRLIIAQRRETKLSGHEASDIEKSLFRESRRLPHFDHERIAIEDQLWSTHDLALFRQCLRFLLQYRFVSFYDHFNSWASVKKDQSATTNEISLLWLSDSLEHLVGVVLLSDTELPSLDRNMEDCTQWMFNRSRSSAVHYGADTLQTLGRLFLVDFMVFLTSKWIKGLSQLIEDVEKSKIPIDEDGIPTIKDYILPTVSLAEKATLLLESLNLSSNTHFNRDNSNPLDAIAEDLAIRSNHMKQRAIQLQALYSAKTNEHFGRSSIRESHAVKRLAILASIFLPLSLSSGILSMQSRLTDIHLVLWDFIAVCIDLALVVLVFFWVTESSRLPLLTKSLKRMCIFPYDMDVTERKKRLKERIWKIVWWTLSLPSLVIVALALNVGMFGQVQTGWKILGYGIAAGAGLLIIIGVLYVVFSFLWGWFDAHDDSGFG